LANYAWFGEMQCLAALSFTAMVMSAFTIALAKLPYPGAIVLFFSIEQWTGS
jgi:hypothetical protein